MYAHGYGIFVFVHTDTLIREPMVSTVTFLASFPDWSVLGMRLPLLCPHSQTGVSWEWGYHRCVLIPRLECPGNEATITVSSFPDWSVLGMRLPSLCPHSQTKVSWEWGYHHCSNAFISTVCYNYLFMSIVSVAITGFETKNRYRIRNTQGQNVYHAVEGSSV